MREVPAPWKHGVVLVCSNQRPDGAPKPSCGRARGEGLKSWLKDQARQGGGAAAECRVLTTSCLDLCPADGVAVALQPGDALLVVDPVADRQALLARVQAHMEAQAQGGDGEGPGGRLRGVLGKLRGR